MPAILKVRSVSQNGSHFFPDIHKINAERVLFSTLKGGYPCQGPMDLTIEDIQEGRFVATYMILNFNIAEKDQTIRDENGGQPGSPEDRKEELAGEDVNPTTHAWFFELKDKDGNVETVLMNTAAWLMSDTGKTLDRFYRE